MIKMLIAGSLSMLIGNPFLAIIFIPDVLLILYVYRSGIDSVQYNQSSYLSLKGPIFTLINNTFNSLFSMRAYKLQPYFTHLMREAQFNNNNAWFNYNASVRYMQVFSEYSGNILVIVNIFVSIGLRGYLDRTTLALSLAGMTAIVGMTNLCVKQCVLVKNQLTSAERAINYSKLPSEAELFNERDLQVTQGNVELKNVNLKYTDQIIALKGVSAKVSAGTKVGIVGRTGSGKSSLMVGLFRLTELSRCLEDRSS
mmetsp:Transcript_25490/g.44404  ORF Transcript_25490/g.44404 Transcript_25490/m.44404 type:complete len:255 (+) Transcript_25490:2347-3111(+)